MSNLIEFPGPDPYEPEPSEAIVKIQNWNPCSAGPGYAVQYSCGHSTWWPISPEGYKQVLCAQCIEERMNRP